MNHHAVLRKLILLEVILCLGVIPVGFFDDRLLPGPLQDYVRAQLEAPIRWEDWLGVALCVPVVPLLITSWVALWRGWRKGRLLYTLGAAAGLLAFPIVGAAAESWIIQLLDYVTTLVEGMILGLLYFSELRQRYAEPIS